MEINLPQILKSRLLYAIDLPAKPKIGTGSWNVLGAYCTPTKIKIQVVNGLSLDMRKPTKWVCAQRRLRSAWASAHSDQSLRCALNVYLSTQGFFMRTAKTLIRLGGCPGWFESSLGAQSLCWFCHVAAHFYFKNVFYDHAFLLVRDFIHIIAFDCSTVRFIILNMCLLCTQTEV